MARLATGLAESLAGVHAAAGGAPRRQAGQRPDDRHRTGPHRLRFGQGRRRDAAHGHRVGHRYSGIPRTGNGRRRGADACDRCPRLGHDRHLCGHGAGTAWHGTGRRRARPYPARATTSPASIPTWPRCSIGRSPSSQASPHGRRDPQPARRTRPGRHVGGDARAVTAQVHSYRVHAGGPAGESDDPAGWPAVGPVVAAVTTLPRRGGSAVAVPPARRARPGQAPAGAVGEPASPGMARPLREWPARVAVAAAALAMVMLFGVASTSEPSCCSPVTVLARTAWRTRWRLNERRLARGTQRGDRWVTAIGSPWTSSSYRSPRSRRRPGCACAGSWSAAVELSEPAARPCRGSGRSCWSGSDRGRRVGQAFACSPGPLDRDARWAWSIAGLFLADLGARALVGRLRHVLVLQHQASQPARHRRPAHRRRSMRTARSPPSMRPFHPFPDGVPVRLRLSPPRQRVLRPVCRVGTEHPGGCSLARRGTGRRRRRRRRRASQEIEHKGRTHPRDNPPGQLDFRHALRPRTSTGSLPDSTTSSTTWRRSPI